VTGRGVLVTGASDGIGRAVAERLAAAGDRIAVHHRSDRSGAERTIASLPGSGHVLVRGDLSTPDGARSVVRQATDGLGTLDVLVCNAASAPTPANRHALGEVSYDDWGAVFADMLRVNLGAVADLAWLVADHLVGRGAPGAIVTIGSRGAFRGEPEHPAYAASKAGLHALGQSLAVALAPHGISVTSVAPGVVATPRQLPRLRGTAGDAVAAESPFGRVGTPEEIAAAVAWLASPEATWCSGTVLDANGASHLRT
jgi:NAD(P)-dependent dehydrogenase (short-subunit alcohol dehydrogenase family)